MPKTSQTAKRLALAQLVTGMKKRLPRGDTYWMNGKPYAHAELIAFFQSEIDALDAIRAARGALAAAVARERAVYRRVRAELPVMRAALLQRFGPNALGEFGVAAPKKPGPKTLAGKVAGAEKSRATRAARGTGEAGKRGRR
jgi:hypothetical protein